eukprot:CAMPEP_0168483966 /NCGR_PEP_ID=MMETSP0228-20121227/65847_1 /TAXON_ID=133427 /ORGANISM="Protoceratium reticulatum, Strain CCCM 535 (=CCMP 1889)" /LENGTH=241 /DNA_ID=CAMNT_0008500477 /DNA_START=39 /DNA_END=766 /DNA_ORIENTATION=+
MRDPTASSQHTWMPPGIAKPTTELVANLVLAEPGKLRHLVIGALARPLLEQHAAVEPEVPTVQIAVEQLGGRHLEAGLLVGLAVCRAARRLAPVGLAAGQVELAAVVGEPDGQQPAVSAEHEAAGVHGALGGVAVVAAARGATHARILRTEIVAFAEHVRRSEERLTAGCVVLDRACVALLLERGKARVPEAPAVCITRVVGAGAHESRAVAARDAIVHVRPLAEGCARGGQAQVPAGHID